jgi:hypothetical protein
MRGGPLTRVPPRGGDGADLLLERCASLWASWVWLRLQQLLLRRHYLRSRSIAAAVFAVL